MGIMLEPRPALPGSYPVNRSSGYPQSIHNLSASKPRAEKLFGASGSRFIDFGEIAPNSTPVRIVTNLVSMVLRTSFPRKVFWVDASEMSISARMGCVIARLRRESMNPLARLSRYNYSNSIYGCSPIPRTGPVVWPNQAIISTIGKNCLEEENRHDPSVNSPAQRASVPLPSLPMVYAPASRAFRKAASIYRASLHFAYPILSQYLNMTENIVPNKRYGRLYCP